METPTTARVKEFGTWTEQTSSSGKRYYYNSATNVSQWEKPTEWKQAEKLRGATAVLKNGNASGGNGGGGGGSASATPNHSVPVLHQAHKTLRIDGENDKVQSSSPLNRIHQPQQQQQPNHQNHQYKQQNPSTIFASSSSSSATTPTTIRTSQTPNSSSQLFKRNSADRPQSTGIEMTPFVSKISQQQLQTQHHLLNKAAMTPGSLPSTSATAATTTPCTSSFPLFLRAAPLSSVSVPQMTPNSATTTMTETISQHETMKRPNEKSPSCSLSEEKYQKYWRTDLTSARRSLGLESFAFELRKHAERNSKSMTSLLALDKDIHSIRTLDRAARLRTALLKQRLEAVRQRISELDSKPQ